MAEAAGTGPRVSVVIPCHNGGAFLPAALASLAQQTVTDFEVIVVDDGSNDPDTLKVLAGLDGEVRLVRQENRGLAGARNAGFARARGAFLLPLDCDDTLEPEFLERTLAALDAHRDAAFAFTHIRLAGERDGVLAKDYNFFAQLFLNQLPYCLLMRAEMWRRVGGYGDNLFGYEDWELNIRAGGMGHFGVVIEAPLFRYRVSAGGMLKSVSNRRHAQTWREIQRRNPALYGSPALLRAWWAWRHRPMPYPAPLLLALWGIHKVLPDPAFNALFRRLMRFSASKRAPATRHGGVIGSLENVGEKQP